MYCIKRTEQDTISYYKYDGWESFPKEGPLDLSGVILFTIGEVENASNWSHLGPYDEFQWYGAYKR